MEDYKIEIKDLLLRHYDVTGEEDDKIYRSTEEILKMCSGVIPQFPITDHDVFEVMKDAGFQIEQKAITEDKCIFEGDETKGLKPEYDEVEVGRIFLWVLYSA